MPLHSYEPIGATDCGRKDMPELMHFSPDAEPEAIYRALAGNRDD